ncbi:hypothetical protein GO013_06860 [Pseudodesulfovibrio sp. JC047]|uniref:hypothetical protein n=1 Tax=Pseudodesulfovibrio sp. JC047 TaxID=2683199 RepID=UPI0013CF899D|nr:hypothetical protein [Pseudodesulfovibrio sp. JC047]NDV19137.1 hypothetical protein [Pseudodesulfovibrio sp. JC047]
MRTIFVRTLVLVSVLTIVSGCALGRKEWPASVNSEDAFGLKLMDGVRQDECLLLQIAVTGATHRLWRASVQYEAVGTAPGQGCEGCPFVPRNAVHFTRDQDGFNLKGQTLQLSICGLEPGIEYRFRVAGKSELSVMPIEYTDVFQAVP